MAFRCHEPEQPFDATEAQRVAADLENEAALLPDGEQRSALLSRAAQYRLFADTFLREVERI